MSTEERPRADRREMRAQRTRTAVAAALLDLLEAGVIEPTARQIAAEAKVSERLVFHHFADLEALYATAAELQMMRMMPLIRPVDPTLPFEQRLGEFVARRGQLFERVTPVRRAALRREPFSPELAQRIKAEHELSRNMAWVVFSREMARLSPEASSETLPALSWAASWETWDYLRKREQLSVDAVSSIVARIIRTLLEDGRQGHGRSANGRKGKLRG
jgi:AcrR family transcriptional regulator